MKLQITYAADANTAVDAVVRAEIPADSEPALGLDVEQVVSSLGLGSKRAREEDLAVNGHLDSPLLNGAIVTPELVSASKGLVPARSVKTAEADKEADKPGEAEGNRAVVMVKVISGQGAGKIYQLGPGKVGIGSGADCDIQLPEYTYDDPQQRVPEFCALLEVSEQGELTVRQATDAIELTLDSTPLSGTQPWPPGVTLRILDWALQPESLDQPEAALRLSKHNGTLDFNRPPRLLPAERSTEFKLPSPPEPNAKNSLPWIGIFAPLVLAIVMVSVTRQPYFLMFGLMSPVMAIANYVNSKRTGKVTLRERRAKYRTTKRAIEDDANAAVAAYTQEKNLLSPDPATVGLIATRPSPRLWERRRTDPDHLSVRVGVAEAESDVTLYDPVELEHKRTRKMSAPGVPVTISFAQYGVVGIYGDDDSAHRGAAWMIGQLVVTQSPRDVQVVVLTQETRDKEWGWSRWAPHLTSDANVSATIGNDMRSIGQRISELSQIIAARQSASESSDSQGAQDWSSIVVVFDGASRLRQWPGASQILTEGPQVGVYALCIDTEERFLPEESRAIVETPSNRKWTVRRDRQVASADITGDLPDWNWFEWVTRGIAPIRDVSEEGGSSLPTSSRFLELVGLPNPTPEEIRGRWNVQKRSTTVALGESFDGPFTIDIRQDGPHALIAGTTGAGKSELLQTFIASAALANRPDELSFVLVDYKGNAAFKDFVNLPHTAGIVTDLDEHLVERAMTSLRAELRRRERLLATVGAKDIDEFTSAREKGRTTETFPRLFLVIDEFAALKAELPEFVNGVVNIAQRGRSLGIHLVMATQRPAGSITADILANTNLRVALRMADASESRDVIGTADAATISTSTPGRAFVWAGSNALLPFQTARVTNTRLRVKDSETKLKPAVVAVPWSQVGAALPALPKGKATEQVDETDLQVLVQAIAEAADQEKIASQASPWLPTLPEIITLAELTPLTRAVEAASPSSGDSLVPVVPFGLQDFPEAQRQSPALINFADFSHMLIVGAARTGRTQTLRTIAGSIAEKVSPELVHFYGIDYGGGGLQALNVLPQMGTVVGRDQILLFERLLSFLTKEAARRRVQLASEGFPNISEQYQSGSSTDRLPHIVVLFDQWEAYVHGLGDNGNHPSAIKIFELLREGASVGIHFIISGDRSLGSAKIAALVDRKLVLRLNDPLDYTAFGLKVMDLPAKIGPGRAFVAPDARELQIAVLDQDLNARAQGAALVRIADTVRERLSQGPAEGFNPPVSLEDLPVKLSWEDMGDWSESVEAGQAVLGLGGEEVEPVAIDFDDIPTFVIGGMPRSGKSTALVAMARSLLQAGTSAALLTPVRSPLRALAGMPGVVASMEGADITAENIDNLLSRDEAGRLVMIVDDFSMITDFGAADALKKIGPALNSGRLAVVAADNFDEISRVGMIVWPYELVKRRRGAVLDPQNALELRRAFGLEVPQHVISQPRPLGRAYANLGDGKLVTVQVPFD